MSFGLKEPGTHEPKSRKLDPIFPQVKMKRASTCTCPQAGPPCTPCIPVPFLAAGCSLTRNKNMSFTGRLNLSLHGLRALDSLEHFSSRNSSRRACGFCFCSPGLPHNVSAAWPIVEGEMECLRCISEGWTFSPPCVAWPWASASAATPLQGLCISPLLPVRSWEERPCSKCRVRPTGVWGRSLRAGRSSGGNRGGEQEQDFPGIWQTGYGLLGVSLVIGCLWHLAHCVDACNDISKETLSSVSNVCCRVWVRNGARLTRLLAKPRRVRDRAWETDVCCEACRRCRGWRGSLTFQLHGGLFGCPTYWTNPTSLLLCVCVLSMRLRDLMFL